MKIELVVPDLVLEAIAAEVARRVLPPAPPSSGEAPPLLTVPEAASLLRCSRQRVDDLLSQGRLTRIKEGRRTLVARSDIEAHLRRSATTT
jgi:excisionase family DNA binding protein